MGFDEATATGQVPMLRDKVALITGVGSGIGRASARLFQAAGATVVSLERDTDSARSVGDELGIEVIVGDVTDRDAVDGFAALAVERHGRIDVVYNNAGIGAVSPVMQSAHEIPDEVFDVTLDVNLRGTFLVCRSVLPHMLERGGAIVNASSIYGVISSGGSLSYAAAKAGVLGLTRSVACDYASYGIRCNAVCPGFVDTPMPADYLSKQEDPEQAAAAIRDAHLLQRMGKPEEIAATALWLSSDAATFITGAVILADGGYTTL